MKAKTNLRGVRRRIGFLRKWAKIGIEWELGSNRGGPREEELESIRDRIYKLKVI